MTYCVGNATKDVLGLKYVMSAPKRYAYVNVRKDVATVGLGRKGLVTTANHEN